MAKFAHSRDLPVVRLVHINMGSWKDDKTLLIHLCRSETHDSTTKQATSFWHTDCGKNMDYAEVNPRQHTIKEALKENSGVKFCPRCGTTEDFLNAITAYEQYDIKRRATEERERIERDAEIDRKWNVMCNVLKNEVADVLSNRKTVVEGERDNEANYYIVRNGVTYKLSMKISEVTK
jgi:hypothetical protein